MTLWLILKKVGIKSFFKKNINNKSSYIKIILFG
jgi:hypothetical protein